jgi:tetratricopeptide (TPR) repeat protein
VNLQKTTQRNNVFAVIVITTFGLANQLQLVNPTQPALYMKITFTIFFLAAFISIKSQSSSDVSVNSNMFKAQQYLTGNGEQKNEAAAFELYMTCAKLGRPQAMNMVGVMYKNGMGTGVDENKAIEWFTKAGEASYTNAWYLLGDLYKNVPQQKQNYAKAFSYFSKGATLNDGLSQYSKAYMLYKGFGCKQDYSQAANLFAAGAKRGEMGSMYFYGLCFRNGYGVQVNFDSAKYWLTRASQKGYTMARNELQTLCPENCNVAKSANRSTVAGKGQNESTYLNIGQDGLIDKVDGNYTGKLIVYDWSGQHIISTAKVTLSISFNDNIASGFWIENDAVAVPLKAKFTPDGFVFSNTKYSRKDHNSFESAITCNFEKASFKWVKSNDTTYLTGNLHMFSPERNEPQKPQYFILIKDIKPGEINNQLKLSDKDDHILVEGKINVYPNPFTNKVIVDFELTKRTMVQVQLKTMDGKIVFTKTANMLKAGYFTFPVQPKNILPGVYFLTVNYNQQAKIIKVIKL